MNRRGYTLVELIIAVAILGILTVGVAGSVRDARLRGLAQLQRERALLLLAYHAACVADGRPVKAPVEDRLVEALPEARVERRSQGDLATLTVSWRPPRGGIASRSLTVFAGAGAP